MESAQRRNRDSAGLRHQVSVARLHGSWTVHLNVTTASTTYGSVSIRMASTARTSATGPTARSRSRRPSTIAPTAREGRPFLRADFRSRERTGSAPAASTRASSTRASICDRCGVKVTHSRERRKRMGHINWPPRSCISGSSRRCPASGNAAGDEDHGPREGHLLPGLRRCPIRGTRDGDSGRSDSSSPRKNTARRKTSTATSSFEAIMGAEAVKKLLLKLDLGRKLSEELRRSWRRPAASRSSEGHRQAPQNVEALRDSDNKPEWMVLDVIPVIPPDLRPLVLLESGNFATPT